MTEPNEPQKHEHEVHISFEQPAPKPPKVHRVRDICWIIIAAGLIGTVFKSSLVFALVACACITLYIIGGPKQPKTPG